MKTQCACGGNCKCNSKITKDTVLSDVLEINPDAAETLFEAGLGCFGCHFSTVETVEQGCRAHGMSEEDINDLLTELNKHLEKAPEKVK